MGHTLRYLANDLLDLIYPRVCAGCTHGVPVRGEIFCMRCLGELPETGFHLVEDNPFEQQFWGRVPVQTGAAMYYFIPHGITQVLLHNIKYRGRSDFGRFVGKMYGSALRATPRFAQVDSIVPVPLHWRKRRKRGFNQSSMFAQGLAESLEIEVIEGCLIRHQSTRSLTNMARHERVRSISKAFSVKGPEVVAGRCVLLVDDVLTTGATLEACALRLTEAGALVSMATIACGRI